MPIIYEDNIACIVELKERSINGDQTFFKKISLMVFRRV